MVGASIRLPPKYNRICSVFFFGIFFLVGIPFTWYSINTFFEAQDTVNWPTVHGVVNMSRIDVHSGSKGGTTYCPEIFYEYVIDGITYSSDNFRLSHECSSPSYARSIVNRYPAGPTTVYYKPDDPATSVLQTGTDWGDYFMICGGLVFALVGFFGVFSQIFPGWFTRLLDQHLK